MKNEYLGNFPVQFKGRNPIYDRMPESIYIRDKNEMLKIAREIPQIYLDFFHQLDFNLSLIASQITNEELSSWIISLKEQTGLLEIHDNSKLKRNDFFIQFTKYNNLEEWSQSYPSYGITLELIDTANIPEYLPRSLAELYGFGRLYLQGGISCSGYFYHPDEIKLAVNEEWLCDYISDDYYMDLGYPIKDLMVFYTDSGCWLMYDQYEHVYCGGIECGDFYKSSKNLREVISIIFSKLSNNNELSIEGIAPK